MKSLLEDLHIEYQEHNHGKVVVAKFKENYVTIGKFIKDRGPCYLEDDLIFSLDYPMELTNLQGKAIYREYRESTYYKNLTKIIARKRLVKKFYKAVNQKLMAEQKKMEDVITNINHVANHTSKMAKRYEEQEKRLIDLSKCYD